MPETLSEGKEPSSTQSKFPERQDFKISESDLISAQSLIEKDNFVISARLCQIWLAGQGSFYQTAKFKFTVTTLQMTFQEFLDQDSLPSFDFIVKQQQESDSFCPLWILTFSIRAEAQKGMNKLSILSFLQGPAMEIDSGEGAVWGGKRRRFFSGAWLLRWGGTGPLCWPGAYKAGPRRPWVQLFLAGSRLLPLRSCCPAGMGWQEGAQWRLFREHCHLSSALPTHQAVPICGTCRYLTCGCYRWMLRKKWRGAVFVHCHLESLRGSEKACLPPHLYLG